MMSKNPKRRRNMRLRDDSCLKFKMKENLIDDSENSEHVDRINSPVSLSKKIHRQRNERKCKTFHPSNFKEQWLTIKLYTYELFIFNNIKIQTKESFAQLSHVHGWHAQSPNKQDTIMKLRRYSDPFIIIGTKKITRRKIRKIKGKSWSVHQISYFYFFYDPVMFDFLFVYGSFFGRDSHGGGF